MNAMGGGWCKRSLVAAVAMLLGGIWFTPTAAAQTPLSPTETLSALREPLRVESGQKFFVGAKNVGSQSCKSCHEKQHGEWADTWHAKMERLPSPESVIGDFNNRVIVYKDLKVKGKDGKESTISPSVMTSRKGDNFYFTLLDQDNAANNQTYEIAKTLGGKWDQHYEIKIGDNYLPTPIRWSVAANDWLITQYNPHEWFEADGSADGRPKKMDELPLNRVAEVKCAGCHTTGFEFAKDKQTGIWKATGNGELGIACEKCHGPGSKHVEEANAAKARGEALKPGASTIVHPLKDLSSLQQTQVCAQCHGRHANKEIGELAFQQGFLPGDIDMTSRARYWNYSSTANPEENKYFWPNDWAKRNRQQWQDFTKSKHSEKGISCLTCHTFHGKAENAQLRLKPEELCTSCHTINGYAKRPNGEMFKDSPMQKAGVQCVDCHMPKIGYRSDQTAKGPHPWDVTSHTFMVPTPALEKNYGVRSACTACHIEGKKLPSGAQAPAFDANVLNALLIQRQKTTRGGIGEVQKVLAGINGINAQKAETKALVEQANAKLDFVLLDGSLGMHNADRAAALITEARKLAEKAAKMK